MEEKKQVTKKKDNSLIYRVEEYLANVDETISNLNKVIFEQDMLIDYLKQHPENKFKDLINQLNEQLDGYKKKLEDLSKKKVNLNKIINFARGSKNMDEYLTLVLENIVNF